MNSAWLLFAAGVLAPSSPDISGGLHARAQSPEDARALIGSWITPPIKTDANYFVQEQYGYACKLEFVDALQLNLMAPGLSETGTYHVDLKQFPAAIDFEDEQGKPLKGILKIQQGKLWICWGFSGADRPTTFRNGSHSVVMVLQRVGK